MNDGLAPLVTWVPSRAQRSLNGAWKSIIDVYDVGVGGSPFSNDPRWGFPADRGLHSPGRRAEYDFDLADALDVPGDWNTQDDRFHFYEGSMWYRQRFESPSTGRRAIVYLAAANYATTVFLNGRRIGDHEGGYGPFCLDVTDDLRVGEDNSLVIRVDNTRRPDAVPTTHTDWFNYGGIIRDVLLLDLPETYVRDAVVQLDPAEPDVIAAEVWLDGTRLEQLVTVEVGGVEVGSLRTGPDGHGRDRFAVPPDLVRWAPGHPVLHEVVVRAETDTVTDRIGFRTIAARGSEILLNGEPIFLAGISVHDEALGEPTRRIRSASPGSRTGSTARA